MRLPAIFLLLGALRAPDAADILQKAEAVRNPSLDYAVDFTIHALSKGVKPVERDASYSMIASGKDRTLILMRSPSNLYGALVLMADDRCFMLLPRATKPWELSATQMLAGDIATGDLARSNLIKGYTATLAGKEEIAGETCWRLELIAASDQAHYGKIVYWITKKGFLPRKLDHYGRTGKLAKTVEYGDYRKGALGLRPMRLQIESLDEWKEASTLTFTNLRRIQLDPSSFGAEGMMKVRDAALAAQAGGSGEAAAMEHILRAAGR